MEVGDFFVKGLPAAPEVPQPPVTAVKEDIQGW